VGKAHPTSQINSFKFKVKSVFLDLGRPKMITLDTSFFMAILVFILSRFKRIEIKFKYSIKELVADILPISMIIIVVFLTQIYLLNAFSSFEYNFLRLFHRVIVYPVLEEILFRYYLIFYAQKVNQNKYFLVLLSSGIFAALHLNRGINIAVFAFAVGVICSVRYLSTKNILNPIVCHASATLLSNLFFSVFQELQFYKN
jgi:membrane protease YdiL (CAAX protease family)